jgi:hypothetical protein
MLKFVRWDHDDNIKHDPMRISGHITLLLVTLDTIVEFVITLDVLMMSWLVLILSLMSVCICAMTRE